MKKFAVIAVALCVAILMAVPASALEITTDGYFRARYIGAWNAKMTDLDNVDNGANSYGDYRLRVNNVFKVNDNLMLRTRFRALNGTRWGGASAGNNNFQWERAWMVAKFNWGIMEVGRMGGGTWGTSFNDAEFDADRIKFTFPIGNAFTLLAIYQKSAELDDNFIKSDTDVDTFYLAGVWKAENMSAGLLGAYSAGKSNSDTAPGLAPTEDDRFYATPMSLLPFFTGKWGAFGFQAEGRWNFGKARDYVQEVDSAGNVLEDGDVNSWALNLEASFDFGMGNAQLGWAYATGQERTYNNAGVQVYDSDVKAASIGADWAKLYILTGDTGPQSGRGVLGGYGAFGAGGNIDGISLIYGGADFKPMENLSLGFIAGWGKANEVWDGQDTDLGFEIDLIAQYTIFDNLTNTLKIAYLNAGDYWKGSEWDPGYVQTDDKFDSSVWTVMNELKLSF